jgi:hypothetical protein
MHLPSRLRFCGIRAAVSRPFIPTSRRCCSRCCCPSVPASGSAHTTHTDRKWVIRPPFCGVTRSMSTATLLRSAKLINSDVAARANGNLGTALQTDVGCRVSRPLRAATQLRTDRTPMLLTVRLQADSQKVPIGFEPENGGGFKCYSRVVDPYREGPGPTDPRLHSPAEHEHSQPSTARNSRAHGSVRPGRATGETMSRKGCREAV